MPILTVTHVTTYHYAHPVAFGEHRMMLRPRDDDDQKVLESELEIDPEPSQLTWTQDIFGNHVAIARFAGRASELRFESITRLDHAPAGFRATDIEDFARTHPFSYAAKDRSGLTPFVKPLSRHPRLDRWTAEFLRADGSADTHQLLVDMTQTIQQTFKHVARHEKGIQDPIRTLSLASGSCRDLAVLMIAALRSLGIAARFVSGYLHVADDEDCLTGGNTHAWVQVCIPGPGWVDFDPSSGIVGNQNLVRVAVVHEARKAIPLQGTWFGTRSDHLAMKVAVKVKEAAGGREHGIHAGNGWVMRPATIVTASGSGTTERKRGTFLLRGQTSGGAPLSRLKRFTMKIRAGYVIAYDCPQPTPMILQLSVHPSRIADLLSQDCIRVNPPIPANTYHDSFGNLCHVIRAPAGRLTISSDFLVQDQGEPDAVAPQAKQHALEDLPVEVLIYLLGSRYCETDRLSKTAWSLFGQVPKGWPLVQAICDYVHNRITFGYEHASPTKTALEAHTWRRGVCRDFAHLAVTLCRCMNVPARYCTGYLGDIGVPPEDSPMDFSAWFEAYLGGRWYTFDARHNKPRIGRILMARGRDATDVAIVTSFGPCTLASFKVITDEVTSADPAHA